MVGALACLVESDHHRPVDERAPLGCRDLLLRRLSQANSGSTTVLVNEFDAGGFQSSHDCFDGPFLELIAALKSGNGVNGHFGSRRKLPNTPAEGSTSHPTLNRKNHNIVLILVAMSDELDIITVL